MGLGDERIQIGGDGGDARFPIGGQIDFFVGEVDRAFGENARVDNLSRDGARGARKIPLQSAAGGAGGGFGLRANEQIDGFGLGEVEFSVQIRAQRKFARRRPPRAQPLATRAQRGENRFAAVRVQFEQVLAGGGFWRLEIQREAVVYDPLVGVVKPRADGDGGRRQIAPQNADRDAVYVAAADADNADCARPGGGGDGDNRSRIGGGRGRGKRHFVDFSGKADKPRDCWAQRAIGAGVLAYNAGIWRSKATCARFWIEPSPLWVAIWSKRASIRGGFF